MWSLCLSDPSTFLSFLQDARYLPWTWSIAHVHLSVACCAFRPTAGCQQDIQGGQYESLNIENGAWINARRSQTSHHQKIKSIQQQEKNLFQDNGMINIHGLIKSSKGYTFQNHLLDWISTTFSHSQSGESWHFVCCLSALHHFFLMVLFL